MKEVLVTQLPDCYLVQGRTTKCLTVSCAVDALVAVLSAEVSGEITVLSNNRTADVYYMTARVE